MNSPGTRCARMTTPVATAPMELDGHSDDDLMGLVDQGRHEAFNVLVRRHQQRVLGIAVRYLGDAAHAPDIAQNTFVELYRGRAQYVPQGRFRAYLSRIALNQCRMVTRSRWFKTHVVPLGGEIAQPSEDPASRHDRGRDVERALSGLSDKLRSVVVLRYSADLSFAEIGETLGIPVGTAKRRLFDAMALLRCELEEQ